MFQLMSWSWLSLVSEPCRSQFKLPTVVVVVVVVAVVLVLVVLVVVVSVVVVSVVVVPDVVVLVVVVLVVVMVLVVVVAVVVALIVVLSIHVSIRRSKTNRNLQKWDIFASIDQKSIEDIFFFSSSFSSFFPFVFFSFFFFFLDAFSHLYKRVRPSDGSSVRPLVRPSHTS